MISLLPPARPVMARMRAMVAGKGQPFLTAPAGWQAGKARPAGGQLRPAGRQLRQSGRQGRQAGRQAGRQGGQPRQASTRARSHARREAGAHLTRSFSQSLTHSIPRSLTHSLTVTHSLTRSLTHSLNLTRLLVYMHDACAEELGCMYATLCDVFSTRVTAVCRECVKGFGL